MKGKHNNMNNIPNGKTGLYSQEFEHNSCGIGCVVNINGKKSHSIINDGLTLLRNMAHRGGSEDENDSGDGAGILIQLPHEFFEKVCRNENINLPVSGGYGVGMVFTSPDSNTRLRSIEILKSIIKSEGQGFLGIREVAVNSSNIGVNASMNMPFIMQVFIGRKNTCADDFERTLYIIMKQAEKQIRKSGVDNYFYCVSFSSKTIVYKGMLTAKQVTDFYPDLKDEDMKSAIALVHSRFSTNTFPSWERAHPNRMIIHNGEINTIHSNINWLSAREHYFSPDKLSKDMCKILPVVNKDGSDSSVLDEYIHFLYMSGMSLNEAVMSLIPPPWVHEREIPAKVRDFYEYYSGISESWDGPAAVVFTDGRIVGATLDRNGLRPVRYCITGDGKFILSSEAGALETDEKKVLKKGMLSSGKMIAVDILEGKVITDNEIKKRVAETKCYKDMVQRCIVDIESLPEKNFIYNEKQTLSLSLKEKLFGYTWEDINITIKDIVEKGTDPIGAMGNDTPPAILSDKPQLLYNYFHQRFAQVTNPPIDSIREKNVIETFSFFGSEDNIFDRSHVPYRKIRTKSPVLSDTEIRNISSLNENGFKSIVIPILFKPDIKNGLKNAIDNIFLQADKAIENGCNIIILSDIEADNDNFPIPSLIAGSGLHQHLLRNKTRLKTSIIIQSGEVREVHHFASLVSFGVNGIHPYLVYEIIRQMKKKDTEKAIDTYKNAITKGIVKAMSKMGITTMTSYLGSQNFEAVGINESVIEQYFSGTISRLGGLRLKDIEEETINRIRTSISELNLSTLKNEGEYKWRAEGEKHIFNPITICKLQQACKSGDYTLYKEFADEINNSGANLRSILSIRTMEKPLSLDKIESEETILRRFKTGAMSYGSISKEAHECIALAMNRIGGKSNSGEGGETKERQQTKNTAENKCSAVKQVASGRFGVDISYLNSAKEIQIKIAQGAKPGEGGHLPGTKVNKAIAVSRHSTPGVGLISPPPHHDIYSIEDISQLIMDLKNANPDARIAVKLVSEAGVGTVAVGVAKSKADVIVVSGYDGGTGAAPRSGIKHAGLPWELGLAETHQTLLMNNLRNKVTLETDGKLLTGRDVLIAALLGAEEYAFATGVLISIGCVMMRVCHLDTCPVGIATQNEKLRKNFSGKSEYVENFMRFVARDLREWMARTGVRTVDEMIGHTELLEKKHNCQIGKAENIDFSALLYQPKICSNDFERYHTVAQEHHIEKTLDIKTLLPLCQNSILYGKRTDCKLQIRNTDRSTGAVLSSEIVKRYGSDGLEDNTVNLEFYGSAGQSFGAFLVKGVTMTLFGQANDYIGKGLSGGRIIVRRSLNSKIEADKNIIIGNVAFYGAISGRAYINGISGARFCVRNSGLEAVVEGVGDHGCEYMTGGCVLVIGKTGRNFAAGMSGGVAYVYNEDGSIFNNCNRELVLVEETNAEDKKKIKSMLEDHFKYTASEKAERILSMFKAETDKFIKIVPEEYKAMLIKQDRTVGENNG